VTEVVPLTAVERKGRVLGHRGKRKNRRFKKTICYASRKRLQKLGRFVNCSILYFIFSVAYEFSMLSVYHSLFQ